MAFYKICYGQNIIEANSHRQPARSGALSSALQGHRHGGISMSCICGGSQGREVFPALSKNAETSVRRT